MGEGTKSMEAFLEESACAGAGDTGQKYKGSRVKSTAMCSKL